jgi:hypothetical protein
LKWAKLRHAVALRRALLAAAFAMLARLLREPGNSVTSTLLCCRHLLCSTRSGGPTQKNGARVGIKPRTRMLLKLHYESGYL